LQVGNGGTNGTLGSGVITNNGQLVFNRSDTNLVIPNVIRGSGALTNAGTGRVSLSGASAFSGQVTVLQGTLRVLNSSALGGTIAGGVIVSNGATLDITNNANIGRDAIIAGGAGVGGNGAIINSSSTNGFVAANFSQLTLYTNIVIGGSGRLDFRASSSTAADANLSTAGAPYTLTKIGSNLLQMAGVQIDGGLGDIIVNGGGTLGFQWQMPSLGNPTNNLVVSNGTSIAFFDMSNAVTKNLFLSNNASVLAQQGPAEFDGPVALAGTGIFNATGGAAMLFANEISGNGSLLKTGTSTVTLSLAQTNGGAEIYSGNTTISQGTLALLDNANLTNSPSIILSNATLSVTGRVDSTLTVGAAMPQTLAGGGVINGTLVVDAGSTINPGNNSTAVLTVSNATTLNGSVLMDLNIGAASVTNDEIAAPSFSVSGPLTVTNIGPDLQNGDHFQLFNQAVSGFSSVTLPANNGTPNKLYQWRNDLAANGSITLTNVIVISPTTNASITHVFLSGTNLVLQGTNNNVPNTNFHYQVLVSTNVATKLSNWVAVATNSFNPDGTFNYTNPIVPGKPQQFLDVKVVP
jgi:autotransporter-associated beta strand protein